MDTVPLWLQLAEVKREIALRERVYPRFVRLGKISQARADSALKAMKAVAHTLEQLQLLGQTGVTESRTPGLARAGPSDTGPASASDSP